MTGDYIKTKFFAIHQYNPYILNFHAYKISYNLMLKNEMFYKSRRSHTASLGSHNEQFTIKQLHRDCTHIQLRLYITDLTETQGLVTLQ